jgi:uncharacterized protein YacL
MLSDISNINNNIDLLYIITAVVIVDMIIILIARDTTFLGKTINEWYDKFGITAVILDVLIIVIGFIITRYSFSFFNLEFSPLLFIGIALIVQIIHDILLYQFVILPYPTGNNKVIDIYKKYADEDGSKIIIADSTMMIFSALIAMYLKDKPMHVTSSLLIGSLYIIPYFLNQKVKYP